MAGVLIGVGTTFDAMVPEMKNIALRDAIKAVVVPNSVQGEFQPGNLTPLVARRGPQPPPEEVSRIDGSIGGRKTEQLALDRPTCRYI